MTDEELRDLQERVALVNELTQHPGWAMLLDRAYVKMMQKQTYIIQGKCKDHEEYIKEVSFTDGMEYLWKLPAQLNAELELALSLREPEEEEEDE